MTAEWRYNGVVTVKVTAWVGATNPLSWAAGQTAPGSGNVSMKSAMLSVSFINDTAGSIAIDNLPEPFLVTIDLDPAAAAEEVALCSHWDVVEQVWRSDGTLVNRTSTQLVCSFPHLTDFGGLFGPSNEMGSVEVRCRAPGLGPWPFQQPRAELDGSVVCRISLTFRCGRTTWWVWSLSWSSS